MKAGDRVRLHAPNPVLTFHSPLGVVVGPESNADGYWLVRLDAPAIYHDGAGAYELSVIREHEDNLTVEVRA